MNEQPLATKPYDHVVVIDTQVVLETKPLDQLPWNDLFPGRVLLLVCRQVQWEIDARKQDGRHSKRARAFNAVLDGFLETRVPVAAVAPHQVDVALMRNGRIKWDDLPDLDPDEGDDRIIAQALNALVEEPERIIVFSHDMRPRDAAIIHGLTAVKLPESWLKEAEPSPDQRKIRELEDKVRLLSVDQPKLKVTIEPVTPGPWQFRSVRPLDPDMAERLYSTRLAKAPRASRQSNDPYGMRTFDYLNYDSSHGSRLAEWRKQLRLDTPKLHEGLTRLLSQKLISVRVENVGSVSAEGVSLEIRSGNTVLRSMPFWVLVGGAKPPQPRSPYASSLSMGRGGLMSPHREPHLFYWDEEEAGARLQLSCGSFRQEKSYEVVVSVELLSGASTDAHFEAVVTASNLRGDARVVRKVPIETVENSVEEVYDLGLDALKERPLVDLAAGIERDELLWLNNDGSEYEWD